jgi:hypothetical protein
MVRTVRGIVVGRGEYLNRLPDIALSQQFDIVTFPRQLLSVKAARPAGYGEVAGGPPRPAVFSPLFTGNIYVVS